MQTASRHLIASAMSQRPSTEAPTDPRRIHAAFDRYHQRMYRAAYRVTGNAEDAEDVLQTVFLRLARREEWPDVAPEALGHYLHRAAINAGLDLLRERSRARLIPLDSVGRRPAPDRDAAERAEDEDLRARLRGGIAELSPRAAEIFTLRYVEGFGNQEIADIIGTSESAIGVSLHRSRERLRRLLAQDDPKPSSDDRTSDSGAGR